MCHRAPAPTWPFLLFMIAAIAVGFSFTVLLTLLSSGLHRGTFAAGIVFIAALGVMHACRQRGRTSTGETPCRS